MSSSDIRTVEDLTTVLGDTLIDALARAAAEHNVTIYLSVTPSDLTEELEANAENSVQR